MMLITSPLLDLSNTLFITIIIGYVGYFISYHGFSIKADDKFYKILLFSFPSIFIFYLHSAKITSIDIIYLSLLSCFFTVVLSVLWRKWGKSLLRKLLSKFNISNSNDNKSVQEDMEIMLQNGKYEIGYINVYLLSGDILFSDLSLHSRKPVKNMVWDTDGNLLLYVDKRKYQDIEGSVKTKELYNIKELKKSYQHTITFIPKEQINKISWYIEEQKNV